MKQKILLFVSLVLLAVQGWALPVDSLTTGTFSLANIHNSAIWTDVSSTTIDQTNSIFQNSVNPNTYSPDDYVAVDNTGTRGGAGIAGIVKEIVEFIEDHLPQIHIYETNESNPFYNVTVGNSATKTFQVYGDNLNNLIVEEFNNRLSQYGVKLKLQFVLLAWDPITESTIDPILIPQSNVFSVNPNIIRPVDLVNGKEETLTVTFKPTCAGIYKFSFSCRYVIELGAIHLPEKKIPLRTAGPTVIGTAVAAAEPKITVTPTNYAFGTVVKGKKSDSKTFTVTGTNTTGSLTVSSSIPSIFKVTPASLPASGGNVTVTYEPTAAGSHSGTITVSGNGTSAKISVTGTCTNPPTPKITVTPTNYAFGTVVKGKKSDPKTFTVTGTNTTESLTVSSSKPSIFKVTPASLPASGGKVTVTYEPTAVGSHSGIITISGNGTSAKISVTGTCTNPPTPKITVTPTNYAFGTVVKGKKSDPKTFTVTGTNTTESLTVSSSKPSIFKVTPASLPASGGKVTVTYEPTAVGSHSGIITISGNGTSAKISVTGTCVNPSTPKITVNPTSLTFGGYRDSRTFKVTGTNLTGNLKLSSNSDIFTVSPTTITASQAANGVTVTVKCNAAINIQHATGKITISGGGASPAYVNLTLDATAPQPYAPVIEPEGGIEDGNGELINGGIQSANGNLTSSVNELAMNSRIYADGHCIIIESPVGQEAIISDISGRAQRVNLQAGRNEIPVNASGVYIVRIREKTAKLMIK